MARGEPDYDLIGRFRGPCQLCGHRDARHRDWEAIVGQLLAGDTITSVAEDFGLSIETTRLVYRIGAPIQPSPEMD